MTFFSLLQAEDNRIPYLTKALNRIQERLLKAPGHLELEFFSQVNFIGLFVHKDYYDFLEDIVATYAEEIRKVGKSLSIFLIYIVLSLLYFHFFFRCVVCVFLSYSEYSSQHNHVIIQVLYKSKTLTNQVLPEIQLELELIKCVL